MQARCKALCLPIDNRPAFSCCESVLSTGVYVIQTMGLARDFCIIEKLVLWRRS